MRPKSYKEIAKSCGSCIYLNQRIRSEVNRTLIDYYCNKDESDLPSYEIVTKNKVCPSRGWCGHHTQKEIV